MNNLEFLLKEFEKQLEIFENINNDIQFQYLININNECYQLLYDNKLLKNRIKFLEYDEKLLILETQFKLLVIRNCQNTINKINKQKSEFKQVEDIIGGIQ